MGDNRPGGVEIGFAGILQILFIAFKLLGIINWTWFWVLSPIWIEVAIVIAVFVVCFIIGVCKYLHKKK